VLAGNQTARKGLLVSRKPTKTMKTKPISKKEYAEYIAARKTTEDMLHASKVRVEYVEMEKELYRRDRARRGV